MYFSVLRPSILRNFESVVRLLAERGHRVHLSVVQPGGTDSLEERLAAELPAVTWAPMPPLKTELRSRQALELRSALDYLQFLHPRYPAPYRARAARRVPRAFRALAGTVGRVPIGRSLLETTLHAAERLTPPSPRLRQDLVRNDADVVLLSPAVGLRTTQPDTMRAAQALGLPTAVCVASWDHLSSKSLIRPLPDVVTVWNETQKREAVELHGIPPRRIRVTGAQCFDHWFGWQPRSRADFCAVAGVDPQRPFVLYTCFTPFPGGPSETQFVLEWIQSLRSSAESVLHDLGIVVRPHPKRSDIWREIDLEAYGSAVVFPEQLEWPIDTDARADYFDSIYHSTAVVGLNTSALIEAGIVGRPVHTILVPEFASSQVETLHFRYLLDVAGGLLRVAGDLAEHRRQLLESVRRNGDFSEENRPFIESFVRPHGLDRPATPIFVEEIERLVGSRARSRSRAELEPQAQRRS